MAYLTLCRPIFGIILGLRGLGPTQKDLTYQLVIQYSSISNTNK